MFYIQVVNFCQCRICKPQEFESGADRQENISRCLVKKETDSHCEQICEFGELIVKKD